MSSPRPRGALRIYLGAAPGVGKTFAMLNEGRRGSERGKDVVIGIVETHGRANTADQIRDLETVPRRTIDYRGTTLTEMDVPAILARAPQLVLVDELAHTNAPGSTHAKRWQDIDDLLNAGIDVISTVNVQHLESLNDVVQDITGVEQRETVPDEWVRRADQIELVDMSSEALRRRMAHGNIYPAERVDAALANYFRLGNLTALRELALLWVADRVEESLAGYRQRHGIADNWETRERIVVALTGAPGGDDLVRRAARIASRAKGELIGVHVDAASPADARSATTLVTHRELLEQLGGRYVDVVGDDVPRALLDAARAEQATQLVIGASRRSRLTELTGGSVVNRLIRLAGDIDVLVIGTNTPDADAGPRPAPSARGYLTRRRRTIGWVAAITAPPALTAAMTATKGNPDLSTVFLVFALCVVVTSAVGGLGPGLVVGAVSAVMANWYFAPPVHTLTIQQGEHAVGLFVFVAVALIVSWFVTTAARRTVEANRSRLAAETLVRMSAASVADDPLDALVENLRLAFRLDAAAVVARTGNECVAAAGAAPPTSEADADESLPIGDDLVLLLRGERLDAEDRVVLLAFATQLGAAFRSQRLAREAASASELVSVNELRAGLLAAVSHDLRTPLASIKASVSSLLAVDVVWSPDASREFLVAIEDETDRLTALVGNLLDMSRINAHAVNVQRSAVGVEEVVPAALASLGDRARNGRVVVEVPETLPRVTTDPALLERAMANLIDNALAWSPEGVPVRVEAGAVGGKVLVRIVDHGPGIAPQDRETVFQPFQRAGDRSNGAGVGLGLAVARGFIDAVGGELMIDDTPGGGTTMVVEIPEAAR